MRSFVKFLSLAIVALLLLMPLATAQQQRVKVYYVPILGKWMTKEEIAKEIAKEGEVVVADWTYGGLVETVHAPGFAKYVKERYGVDIRVKWVGTQTPEVMMSATMTALKAGKNPPYDVMAIEIPFFFRAKAEGIIEPVAYEGNPLIPNLKYIHPFFKQFMPYGIIFQGLDTAGLLIREDKAPFVKSYADLADPKLKGHVVLPTVGTMHFAHFLLNLAFALGKDYKNPEDMKEVIKYAATKIAPNVLRYTVSEAEIMELLERGEAWAVAWWWYLAPVEKLKGYPVVRVAQPQGSVFVPGVVWVPKNVKHPVLAQLFIDFIISPDHQLCLLYPELRKKEHASDFVMVHQFLGNDTNFKLLPDWIKPFYATIYPYPLSKMFQWYKFVDFDYVAKVMTKWSEEYRKELRA